MKRGNRIGLSVLAAASLVLAACGSDDAEDATTTEAATEDTTAEPAETSAAVEEPADTTTAEEPADTEAPVEGSTLDTNGDGKVVFGIAAAGPRDDGAYYQALVDKVEEFSAANGFEAPIIVDNITAEDAATELANLAEQGVDVITVGASEIADPLADLTEQYADIFWYCNCGAGFPETPGLAQSQDDGSEIGYSAGVATALLMKDADAPPTVAFLGCCDLGFEKEFYMSYELGLKSVDPAYAVSYVPTGSFPFDFDNTAGATEAFNAALAQGIGAVFPYLGGAHEAIVKLANEAGVITMSAGSSSVCERSDLDYQIAVRFDAGDYLDPILAEITDGSFKEGDVRVFRVGVDPEPGAVICDPTPEQTTAMDAAYATIASGDLAAQFGEIKGTAYAAG